MKNPVTPAGIKPATFRFVAQHLKNCVLDPITGNFRASWFCRILDKFTRRAKPIRIIGCPDNQLPDEWSSTCTYLPHYTAPHP